jgi:hypothetical protein
MFIVGSSQEARGTGLGYNAEPKTDDRKGGADRNPAIAAPCRRLARHSSKVGAFSHIGRGRFVCDNTQTSSGDTANLLQADAMHFFANRND